MPKGGATVQAFEAKEVDNELKLNFVGLMPSSKCATNEKGVAAAVLHVREGRTVYVAAHKLGMFNAQYERIKRA